MIKPKLSLADIAERAFNALTPKEQQVLRELQRRRPVYTQAEIEKDAQEWVEAFSKRCEELKDKPRHTLLQAIRNRRE